MKQTLALAVSALMLNGCTSSLPRLPDLSQELLLNNTLTVKQIVIGAIVLYYAKDGFVWEVEDRNIGEDLYRLTVKQGKLKTTGQGEAVSISIAAPKKLPAASNAKVSPRWNTMSRLLPIISTYRSG